MNRKKTTQQFIEDAKRIHGDKYDYSKVEYINNRTKVCIMCHKKNGFNEEHGEFWQTPDSHLRGNGCPKCVGHYMDNEFFIKKAKEIHGDKYDYSKVEYKGNKIKICIICPEHGEFWQTPSNHCSKYNQNGCPKCKGLYCTTKEFIEKAKEIHGDKYDYSKVEYIDSKTKVCIICPEHGEFWQNPNSHLSGRGCSNCVSKKLHDVFSKTTEEFIEKAREIHGDKYDYSKVEYVNAKTKVCIICPEHGEFWQTPDSHLRGSGCIHCNSFQKSVQKIVDLLQELKINFEREKTFKWLGMLRLDFYLTDYNIAIEYQGEQHFRPIKYFGGEKRFIDRIERDKRKNTLCLKNGIKIIYVSFWEKNNENIIKTIDELSILLKLIKNEN